MRRQYLIYTTVYSFQEFHNSCGKGLHVRRSISYVRYASAWSVGTSLYSDWVYRVCFRKDEAPVKGLQSLARQLLSTSDNGNGEDGHTPSSRGHPGNARHRFQRDKSDELGLSPVASFLLHRFALSSWLSQFSSSFHNEIQIWDGILLLALYHDCSVWLSWQACEILVLVFSLLFIRVIPSTTPCLVLKRKGRPQYVLVVSLDVLYMYISRNFQTSG